MKPKPPSVKQPSRPVTNPDPGSIPDLIRFCRSRARGEAGDDRRRFLAIAHHLVERQARIAYEVECAIDRLKRFTYSLRGSRKRRRPSSTRKPRS